MLTPDLFAPPSDKEMRAITSVAQVVDLFRQYDPSMPASYLAALLAVARDPGKGVTYYARELGIAAPGCSRLMLEIGKRTRTGGAGHGLIDNVQGQDMRSWLHYLTPKGQDLLLSITAVMKPTQWRRRYGNKLKQIAPPVEPDMALHGERMVDLCFVPVDDDGSTAEIDLLTGLALRRGLFERLGKLLRDAPAAGERPGLILLDLNRFKKMNDALGPLICDNLLTRAAARLRSVAPDAALLARVSGNGFAVLLHDGSEADALAVQLLDFMCRPYAVSGHAITLGACIGVSTAGCNGNDALSVFHAADVALHQAQQDGRDSVRRFEPSMHERAARHQSLENDFRAAIALQQVELERALTSDQFEVHYQPQVSLADGHITGFEALLRWRHPERGLVSPSRFIPLAEETGLINLLGEWVLRTACRDAAAWPVPNNGERLRVAVNVSPLQLRDGAALLASIDKALDETGLAPNQLEVELTESALTDDIGDTLVAIRALGVDLALDDFGKGYSSLSRLHRYPFTRLKIDRSFVADLDFNNEVSRRRAGERMVRAIASLGLGLGLDTIVEGIETPHQREVARLAGCTEMQGYLVSRPVRSTDVRGLIARLSLARLPVLKIMANGI